jgi:diguanylate cyclase (GGDEF)-like protein
MDISCDAQKRLRDALYVDTSALFAGASLSATAAVLSWLVTGSRTPLWIAAVIILVTLLRIVIARQRQWQWRRWYDEVFVGAAMAYLLCIGVLTFWAFNYSDNLLVLTMAINVAMVNAMSIALRSFAIDSFVKAQLIAVNVPMFIAFAWRGGWFIAVAGAQIVLSWYIYNSASRLRAIFLSEMTYRSRSETIASRFRFAIDNMSHGMCMIDRDMRIVVSNAEMSECFGLPAGRSLQGTSFAALMRLARRRGTLSREDVERFMSSFDATLAPDSLAQIEAPGAWGRTYELTLKRNDEGGWVLVSQDVTDQRRARAALDAAARFDPMTGLPNRRSFEENLAEALALASAKGTRTEVMFLDLDGFKQINDTLGHKFGDRVLAEAARRLREAVEGAYVSRWGGDEFVILRAGTNDEATQAFAERLIRELSRPVWIEGAEVATGASVGAAVAIGGGAGMDALLQQADMALYAAKRENRGGCRLYEPSMSHRAHQRRLLELDLQAALAARTFELHYQPIVDIETGELVSFEALARWRHPTRGAVSPALFVPVLEDLNLTNAFGAWALQRACEDAMTWPQPVRVGVNVSSRQMDTLADSVRRALTLSGLPPERLELEITETAALAAGEKVCRTLEAVRALGVKIALDDFGTGYSSLSHLMQLPLDKVKIDKTFTQELGKSRKADVLVANIARISSQLGMRVTFEGIETPEQLDRARALGVRAEGQGWLFGRPAPAKDLDAIFAVEAAQAVA